MRILGTHPMMLLTDRQHLFPCCLQKAAPVPAAAGPTSVSRTVVLATAGLNTDPGCGEDGYL